MRMENPIVKLEMNRMNRYLCVSLALKNQVFSQFALLLIICVCVDLFAMCVSTKEECVTDEEDEGQMNETPWQAKKGVICPDHPEKEQSTPERRVHDENGTF